MRITDDQIIDALPPKARAKYEALQRAARAARASVTAILDDVHDARAERDHAIVVWRQQAQAAGLVVSEEPPQLVQLRERVTRLSAEAEAASEAARPATELFAHLRDWVATVIAAGSKIVDVEPSATKMPKDIRGAVAGVRRDLEALDAEIAAVEAAPAPADDLRNRALTELDRLAAAGAPALSPRSRAGDPIGLKDRLTPQVYFVGDGLPAHVGDGSISFLCWLLRDELAARIQAEVSALEIVDPLSDEERDQRLADLSAAKLDGERNEEWLIEQANASGMPIQRRSGADPRAVLKVADE